LEAADALEIPHFPFLFCFFAFSFPPEGKVYLQHHNKLKPKENISISRTSNCQQSQPISALSVWLIRKMHENTIYPSKNPLQLTTRKSIRHSIKKKRNSKF
jgi:hypothetical protein